MINGGVWKVGCKQVCGQINITNGLKEPLGIKGSSDTASFRRCALEAKVIVASTVEVNAGGKA